MKREGTFLKRYLREEAEYIEMGMSLVFQVFDVGSDSKGGRMKCEL